MTIASIIGEICSALIAMFLFGSFLLYMEKLRNRHADTLLHLINELEQRNQALTETALRAHNVPFISSKRETIPSEGWWDRKPKPVVVKPADKEVS